MSLSGNSRSPKRRYIAPLLLLQLFAMFSSAQAAPAQLFYGFDAAAGPGGPRPNSDAAQLQFLSALDANTIGVETFENLNVGSIETQTLQFPGTTVTGAIANLDPGATNLVRDAAEPGNFVFAINGSQYLRSLTATSTGYFELTFSSPQNGIGFYGSGVSDYAGFGGNITPIQLTLDGASPIDILNVNPTSVPYQSINFFGIVTDTPFTTVRLYNSGPLFDGFGLDDLTVGRLEPVPEPSSLALVTVAMVFAGAYLQRQFRSTVRVKG